MGNSMMFRALALLSALLLTAFPIAASAQWQVPANSIPVGQGPGVSGFGSAAPGSAGNPLVSNGPGVSPTFQPLPLAGGGTGANNSAANANDILAYNTGSGGFLHTAFTSLVNTVCSLSPSSCVSVFGYAYGGWWGVTCNGTTDDTSAINSAVAAQSRGRVVLPQGDCVISGTINLKNYVTLAGQGAGLAWSTTGISTTDTYGTRLKFNGGATAPVVEFPARAVGTGLEDITVDGQLTSSYGSSTQYGVILQSCYDVHMRNVSVQYVGYGVAIVPAGGAAGNCAYNRFYDVHILHVNYGILFNPTGSSSPAGVTNNFFYSTIIYDYATFGVAFSQLSDDNHFFGAYLATSVQNSIGIIYNYANPTVQNGVYSNNFDALVMDVFNNNGSTKSIQVNATGDLGALNQTSRITGYISAPGADPVPPLVSNGGRATFDLNYKQTPTVSGCGTGPVIVGTDYAGYVTTGTGTVTSCGISWVLQGSSTEFANNPTCNVSSSNGTVAVAVNPSPSGLTLTLSPSAPSTTVYYRCSPT